jgi:thiol-disulfide isomerase/thioredoxin
MLVEYRSKFCLGLIATFLVLYVSSCKPTLVGYYDSSEFIDKCAWKKKIDHRYTQKRAKQPWLDSLRTLRDSVDVKLFLGTWCSDSKKQVPRFFALQSYMPVRRVEVIAVDTTKKDAKGLYRELKIDSVPTFLFYKQQVLIGRLNVKPPKKKRLEQQLYTILRKAERYR